MEIRKVRKLKEQAARLMGKEKFSKALNIYQDLLNKEPKDVLLMLKVGELNRLVGHSQRSIEIYSQAAEYYARNGLLLRGIAVCKVILDIDPGHTSTQEQLADLYTKKYGGPLNKKSAEAKPAAEPVAEDSQAESHELEVEVEVDLTDIERDVDSVDDDEILIVDEDSQEDIPIAPPAPELEELPYIPLFSDLDRESFIELLNRVPIHNFEADEMVVQEGHKGDSFFVVVSGEVQVIKQEDINLATLGPGTFFGEMALLATRPRRASVKTTQPSEILEVPKRELDHLTNRFPHIMEVLQRFTEQRLLHNLMLTSPLFTPFSQDDRNDLVGRFVSQSYNEGQEIIRQGQEGEGLYLIISGSAQVIGETDSGDEQLLSELKEGDIFGEIAMLTRSKATATVRAAQPSRILCLPKETFNELIMTHPQILILISELSEKRQRGADEGLLRDLASDLEDGSALL